MNSELKIKDETSLSNELMNLQKEAKEHLKNSKAKNTKRAYQTDWRQFVLWCKENKVSSLPASPETIVYYITFLGKKFKASTIKRKMTAISQRHETAGYESPTKTPLVKGVWEGLQRTIGLKETGKEPLWLHDLRKMIEAIPENRLIGIRDRALLVIGWAAALRRSELVELDVEHISFTKDGLILTIAQSKTDQKQEGQEVALPFGSHPLTCPVRNLQRWLEVANITSGPIFRRIDRHGNVLGRLTDQSIRLIVKRYCGTVGLDPEKYGAHSLRSGFCSTAARAGKSEHLIMRQTRHKHADSLRPYIKHGTLFEDNAVAGIGL